MVDLVDLLRLYQRIIIINILVGKMKSLFNQILSHLAVSLIHLSPQNRNLTMFAVKGDLYEKTLRTALSLDNDA
jgi:hypothetical protein